MRLAIIQNPSSSRICLKVLTPANSAPTCSSAGGPKEDLAWALDSTRNSWKMVQLPETAARSVKLTHQVPRRPRRFGTDRNARLLRCHPATVGAEGTRHHGDFNETSKTAQVLSQDSFLPQWTHCGSKKVQCPFQATLCYLQSQLLWKPWPIYR